MLAAAFFSFAVWVAVTTSSCGAPDANAFLNQQHTPLRNGVVRATGLYTHWLHHAALTRQLKLHLTTVCMHTGDMQRPEEP